MPYAAGGGNRNKEGGEGGGGGGGGGEGSPKVISTVLPVLGLKYIVTYFYLNFLKAMKVPLMGIHTHIYTYISVFNIFDNLMENVSPNGTYDLY
jgi:hypothetical protein